MSTYLPNPQIAPLVADIGSHSTKLGYAGEDHPGAIFLSSTAALRAGGAYDDGSTSSATTGSCFVGKPQRDFATRPLEKDGTDGRYELVNPVDPATGWLFSPPSRTCAHPSSLSANNRTADAWESHELFNHQLQHCLHYLGLQAPYDKSPEEYTYAHPLMLIDKSHTPPPLRQRLLEILFETHSMPAAFLLRDAVAACYAVGRTTATVVDCGHSSTTVTPVYEGFVERRGIRRNNACSARFAEERILEMMDGLVVQAGRKRRDRLRRINAKKVDSAKEVELSPAKHSKRDSTGRFLTGKASNEHPIPEYLMPLYQVRRAPTYNTRSADFHCWARLAVARELKEAGIGIAVGSMGYVASHAEGAMQADTNTANAMFMASNKVPYTLPDGTAVEISANLRCDIAELYFGNDAYNTNFRERVLQESKERLREYQKEMEEYCNNFEPSESDKKAIGSIGASSPAAAGDAYSNTSYRGEKTWRHGVRNAKSKTYSAATISNKLYSACLPYVRTSPPKPIADDPAESGAASAASSAVSRENERYFSFLTSAPPAQMVCDSAFRCDRDQQGALLGNVVVCGGGACLPGINAGAGAAAGAGQMNEDAFPDRLREEIEAIVHQHTSGWRVKVTSPGMAERAIASWLGGSILGSLGTFSDMWISKRDYEEFGSAIVNRKCP